MLACPILMHPRDAYVVIEQSGGSTDYAQSKDGEADKLKVAANRLLNNFLALSGQAPLGTTSPKAYRFVADHSQTKQTPASHVSMMLRWRAGHIMASEETSAACQQERHARVSRPGSGRCCAGGRQQSWREDFMRRCPAGRMLL